jgi:hypothetical protein
MNSTTKTKVMTLLIVILTNNGYAAIVTQKYSVQYCSENYNYNYNHFTSNIVFTSDTINKIDFTHAYKNTTTEIDSNIRFCEVFHLIFNDEKAHQTILNSSVENNLENILLSNVGLLSFYFSETATPAWELKNREYLLRNISVENLARYLMHKEYKLYPTKNESLPDNSVLPEIVYLPNNFTPINIVSIFPYTGLNICKCLDKNKPNNHAINQHLSKKHLFINTITKPEHDTRTPIKSNNDYDQHFIFVAYAILNLNNLPVYNGSNISTNSIDTTNQHPPTPVSLPPSVWLFASALIGIASVARRRTRIN